MIKKTKEEKLARLKRKKRKLAAKEKRRKREVTELEKIAVRRALLAEHFPSEWLAPDVEEIAEPEPEETKGQTPPRKGKEKKAAKRKRAKQKSAAKAKLREKIPSGREEDEPETDQGAAADGVASTPEVPRPVVSKSGKPGRETGDKKATKEKAGKRRRAKEKSAPKGKAGKHKVSEREKLAVKEALAAEVGPDAGAIVTETAEAESRPNKGGRKASDRQAQAEKTAKQKRAKQKSAAKDKARKRKITKSEKITAEKEWASEAAFGLAPEEDRLEAAEAKPGKRGRKAAAGEAKKERPAQPESAPPEPLPKELPQESRHAETEKITVRKALLVEPFPVSEASDPRGDAVAGEADEALSAYDSGQDRDADQPGAPIAPPSEQRAADSTSRFWPGVALGTVAVIVGFGYIRHLAREQVLPAPVTAESERAAPSASPAVADTVISKTRPATPSAVSQTNRLSTGPIAPDEAAQSGETPSEPRGSGPDRSSGTSVQHQKGVPADPKPVAAQSSRKVPAPPAGAAKEQAAGFRPERKAPPAAQYQVIRPRVPVEVARWQMPRLYQPYQPYRPQFRPVRPGYPMYICPSEPRVLGYPSTKTGDGK